uniref:Ig-like domain-containing protein n=1 Tax=Glossina austeni TaxID=7395 RepID=A0A1A9VXK3_GLOAU
MHEFTHESNNKKQIAKSQEFALNTAVLTSNDCIAFLCKVETLKHCIVYVQHRLFLPFNPSAPPSSIEIQGYSNNAKVEVRENQDLTLKCIVANSKPAAQIIWFRNNVEYKIDNRNDKVEEITPKRFTTTSNLKLKPTAADDYTEYTCQAKHKALAPDMPMRSIVQLSVLYPPGPPYIQGYTQGETLRRGQTVELICNSRGDHHKYIYFTNDLLRCLTLKDSAT